jgi:hypothetical protein
MLSASWTPSQAHSTPYAPAPYAEPVLAVVLIRWILGRQRKGVGMVVRLKRGEAQSPDFDRFLQKLDSLVTDMEALRDGSRPEELAGVDRPILDRWAPALGHKLYLVGLSTGHPKLVGQNRLISTSELMLVSEDQTYARTLSRWYRLGREVSRTELDG